MDAATIERRPSATAVAAQGHDEDRLAQFGYEQELRRDWGLAHNFGVSFSIISVITGITTLFSYGLNTGACSYLSCHSFHDQRASRAMAVISRLGSPMFPCAVTPEKYCETVCHYV